MRDEGELRELGEWEREGKDLGVYRSPEEKRSTWCGQAITDT